jgi:hypothetical protein
MIFYYKFERAIVVQLRAKGVSLHAMETLRGRGGIAQTHS